MDYEYSRTTMMCRDLPNIQRDCQSVLTAKQVKMQPPSHAHVAILLLLFITLRKFKSPRYLHAEGLLFAGDQKSLGAHSGGPLPTTANQDLAQRENMPQPSFRASKTAVT